MTLRESVNKRPWTFGLTLALLVCAAAQVTLWRRLERDRGLAGRQRDKLRAMANMARDYIALKAGAAIKAEPSRGNEELSVDMVDAVARKMRLRRGSMSENRIDRGDNMRERLVTLTVQSATRRLVADFLLAVEKRGRGVFTRELNMSPSALSPKLVDAKIQFAALEEPGDTSGNETPNTASK